MDLIEVRRALRRFWLPSLAVLLLTLVASYVAATRGEVRYESTAVVTVTPIPGVGGSADAVRFYLPAIVERVGSRSFRAELTESLSEETLAAADELTAVNDVNTGIVRITADGTDAAAVAEMANTAAESIVDAFAPAPGTSVAVVVEIIDEAGPGTEYGNDNVAAIMLAGLVLGLILAASTAMVWQRWSRSLDPATRIRNNVGVPVLAVLPNLPELRAAEGDLAQVITSGPARVVEPFQALRSRLEGVLRGGAESPLAVTSWQQDEGRTTVTAALGLMLAAVGHDVVAIDADLRDPHLHELLGAPLAVGLAELDHVGVGKVVVQTPQTGLGLVAAGIAKTHPSQILAMALPPTLAEIAARTPKPTMLIDAPPLSSAHHRGAREQMPAETATVLGAARSVLLVIDPTTRYLPEIAVAVQRLREDGVFIVGAVLNGRRRRPWRRP
ncbi:hypothetical protein [Desertimonas flava]|uniref:hypothetical protein n=1 Tax=Desertimonas flava TaxID=2064846 RepID=UPI000E34A944|nr:hypothetical protein [Desertimonas flava]